MTSRQTSRTTGQCSRRRDSTGHASPGLEAVAAALEACMNVPASPPAPLAAPGLPSRPGPPSHPTRCAWNGPAAAATSAQSPAGESGQPSAAVQHRGGWLGHSKCTRAAPADKPTGNRAPGMTMAGKQGCQEAGAGQATATQPTPSTPGKCAPRRAHLCRTWRPASLPLLAVLQHTRWLCPPGPLHS